MRFRGKFAVVSMVGLCAGCASSTGHSSSTGGQPTVQSTVTSATPTSAPPPSSAARAPAGPSPAVSVTSTRPETSLSGSPVPADGNSVTSATFVSDTDGWVLLTKHCSTGTCPTLKHTTDGGKTWAVQATPPGGMGQVRFGSPTVGYAFSPNEPGRGGPDLDITLDGGTTWKLVTVPADATGNGVSELAISDGRVWAEDGVPDPAVDEAPLGATTFTRIGEAGNRSALIEVQGNTAYVPGPAGAGPVAPNLEVATGTTVGKPMELPCAGGGQAPGDIGDLTPLLTPADLVVACDGSSTGGGPLVATLFTSSDNGKTWTKLATLPGCGVSSLSRTSKTIIAACQNTGGGILSVDPTGAGPEPLLAGDGFSYIGFTDDTHAVAISGNLADNDTATAPHDDLYLTANGGKTWTPANL